MILGFLFSFIFPLTIGMAKTENNIKNVIDFFIFGKTSNSIQTTHKVSNYLPDNS
jgi:hypothetical protein